MDKEVWKKYACWLRGANYSPQTAINQIEMWHPDSYDPETIDKEFGWAESLGLNSMRVFLHNLVWDADPEAYLARIDSFLGIAERHGIRIIFVFFDCCWNPQASYGVQPQPYPFRHNSGWVQCPTAADLVHPDRIRDLETYQKGIMHRFANDPRIVLWDLYNEPGNISMGHYSPTEAHDKSKHVSELLEKSFSWARECAVSQPITSGVWQGDLSSLAAMSELNRFMVTNSDVISFHAYLPPEDFAERITCLESFGKPLICTEYMARATGNTFATTMPILKQHEIGAINWGFVSGKTQTIYPWDSWNSAYTEEPDPWFHDILHADGTPYKEEEVALIKELCAK